MTLQQEVLLERLMSRAQNAGRLPSPAWTGTVEEAIGALRRVSGGFDAGHLGSSSIQAGLQLRNQGLGALEPESRAP